jgi:hypothetical protein
VKKRTVSFVNPKKRFSSAMLPSGRYSIRRARPNPGLRSTAGLHVANAERAMV